MSRLTIFRDDAFLEEHVLMRAIVALGRHPENDIVLDDRTLSRFHARLERRGDRYVVIDLGAQNGIFLNGNKITGECDLVPGDRIGLGRYVAIFDQENASPSRRRGDNGSGRGPVDDEGAAFESPTTAAEVRRATPTLVLLYNGLEVSRHPTLPGKALVVGRSKSCDVVISLLGLSRRHAQITLESGAVVVRDLGSQNGTWVNNVRIEGERALQHGDLLNFYEYGILFLEDPDVEIDELVSAPVLEADDALAARATGRQDPPSIQTTPIVATKRRPRGAAGVTKKAPLSPLSDDDSQGEDLDALDLGEGSYLGDAFDDVSDDFGSSLAEAEPLDDGTDLVRAYVPGADESSDGLGSATSRVRGGPDDFLSESQTSTVRAKQRTRRWPSEVELEDALSQPGSDRLSSVEVYLGERLFTQVPLSNPVTRIGADPRCELALPPRAKLRPWHVTLVHFGGATLCVRGSREGRVRLGGEDIDQAVLKDGDALDLGTVRVVYRCR